MYKMKKSITNKVIITLWDNKSQIYEIQINIYPKIMILAYIRISTPTQHNTFFASSFQPFIQ